MARGHKDWKRLFANWEKKRRQCLCVALLRRPKQRTEIANTLTGEKEGTIQANGLLDQGLLSCVTCGILSFACVAIIQPREAAAKYLISADCDFLKDHAIGSGEVADVNTNKNWKSNGNNLVADNVLIKQMSEPSRLSPPSDQSDRVILSDKDALDNGDVKVTLPIEKQSTDATRRKRGR